MDHEIKYPEVPRDEETPSFLFVCSVIALPVFCGIWFVGLLAIIGWIAEALR